MSDIVCLISIGNRHFTPSLLDRYAEWLRQRNLHLLCSVLDFPERHNIAAFENFDEDKALELAHLRGTETRSRLNTANVDFLNWDEMAERFSYKKFLPLIISFFENDKHFKNQCINQTFSNLQPRFRVHGVTDKKDPLVDAAARYLLEETALKSGIFASGEVSGEIMPHSESTLQLDLYNGPWLKLVDRRPAFKIIHHDGVSVEEAQIR